MTDRRSWPVEIGLLDDGLESRRALDLPHAAHDRIGIEVRRERRIKKYLRIGRRSQIGEEAAVEPLAAEHI